MNVMLTTRLSYALQIDFTALPTDALHRYLAHFDLIPDLDPSPLSIEDPGPPSGLLRPRNTLAPHGHALRQGSTASPGPTGTSGNRARREPGGNRRRSTRLVEEERVPAPPPVYGDVGEVDGMLAAIAERHFREQEVKEVDTLAAFMCAVQAKGEYAPYSTLVRIWERGPSEPLVVFHEHRALMPMTYGSSARVLGFRQPITCRGQLGDRAHLGARYEREKECKTTTRKQGLYARSRSHTQINSGERILPPHLPIATPMPPSIINSVAQSPWRQSVHALPGRQTSVRCHLALDSQAPPPLSTSPSRPSSSSLSPRMHLYIPLHSCRLFPHPPHPPSSSISSSSAA